MTQSTELAPITALRNELPTLKKLLSLTRAGEDVETLAMQELDYLKYHMIQKPEIKDCFPESVVLAVKTVLRQNLSMDPYAGLVYIKTRNMKVKGPNGFETTVKALEIQPSCNGLLSIAVQCGSVQDFKRPEVTKDSSGKIIGVSVELQHPTGRWETFKFDEDDFLRWRIASHNERQGAAEDLNYSKASAHYTKWKGGIDPEFARAKAIRHGLKKLGTNPYKSKKTSASNVRIKTDIDLNTDTEAAADEHTVDVQHEVVSSTTGKTPPPSSTVDPDKL